MRREPGVDLGAALGGLRVRVVDEGVAGLGGERQGPRPLVAQLARALWAAVARLGEVPRRGGLGPYLAGSRIALRADLPPQQRPTGVMYVRVVPYRHAQSTSYDVQPRGERRCVVTPSDWVKVEVVPTPKPIERPPEWPPTCARPSTRGAAPR